MNIHKETYRGYYASQPTKIQPKRAGRATRFTARNRLTKSADWTREQGLHTYPESSISIASSQLASSVSATRDIDLPLRLAHGYDDEGLENWLDTIPQEAERAAVKHEADNDDKMSKQSLPTGRGFAPAPIPQYIASEQQQSSDSVGSQDSVRTQIPLPYHLPNDASQGYGFTTSSGQQTGNITRPWGTPDMSGTATFENIRGGASGSSRSLNPTSEPYVPPGYPPALQNYNEYGASMTSPFQQPAQLGGMSIYPNNAFGQGRVSAGAQLQGLYGGAPTMNPYAHFGSAGGMNGYNPYNAGIDNSYAASTGVSPAMSHASLAPAQPTYQSLPYGPGTGAGIIAPTEYVPAQTGYAGANQGWAGMYTPQAQYNPQAQYQAQSYVKPENVHRGKVPNGRQSIGQSGFGHGHPTPKLATAPVMSAQSGFGHGRPTSNLATAPVLSAAGKENIKITSSYKEKFGAPVIPPSLASSPSKSGAIEPIRTRTASPERRSMVPEAVPTPGPKTQPLDLEFSSEPRNTATPTLRSRRGQTITNAATSPRKQVTSNNWLDTIPNLANLDSQGSSMQAQSPPKMLSLLGSGANDTKALSTISENDPFVGPPRSRAATIHNNPFAPKPQASPYPAGNRLIGPPSGPSPHLRALTNGGTRLPSLEEALDPSNFPFIEMCRLAREENFGVIKIKNIPYGVTRPEILAFLGRNARIINEQEYEPVHIVMERVTSKTLDCYVEFQNLNEAVNSVNRFETNRAGNRGGRLGSRHVDVELSSQEQLMKDLFPKAKNVAWQGSRPVIIANDPNDRYNSGFQGFISKEELVMLVKHVEAPQRSPFSKECPQRPFECLISTLLKYPWYMVDHITIDDRYLLHKATIELIKLLRERIDNGTDPVNLNNQLFKRVWRAALKCPGFTPCMKDDVVFICEIDDSTALELGVAPYAVWWKPLFTIGHKPNIPADTLMWYVAIIREHLDRKKAYVSLAERAARNEADELPKLFGDLDKLIERPQGWWFMTLGQVATYEWAAIEQVLREILTPALEGRK